MVRGETEENMVIPKALGLQELRDETAVHRPSLLGEMNSWDLASEHEGTGLHERVALRGHDATKALFNHFEIQEKI